MATIICYDNEEGDISLDPPTSLVRIVRTDVAAPDGAGDTTITVIYEEM